MVRRRRWAVIWPPLPNRPSGGCCGLRFETPYDRWLPPDDIKFSWPRLHSPNVNGGEASLDVIIIIELWATSDFQESLDGNRGRLVTLERQMTTRKSLAWVYEVSNLMHSTRERAPTQAKDIYTDTLRVSREGGSM